MAKYTLILQLEVLHQLKSLTLRVLKVNQNTNHYCKIFTLTLNTKQPFLNLFSKQHENLLFLNDCVLGPCLGLFSLLLHWLHHFILNFCSFILYMLMLNLFILHEFFCLIEAFQSFLKQFSYPLMDLNNLSSAWKFLLLSYEKVLSR